MVKMVLSKLRSVFTRRQSCLEHTDIEMHPRPEPTPEIVIQVPPACLSWPSFSSPDSPSTRSINTSHSIGSPIIPTLEAIVEAMPQHIRVQHYHKFINDQKQLNAEIAILLAALESRDHELRYRREQVEAWIDRARDHLDALDILKKDNFELRRLNWKLYHLLTKMRGSRWKRRGDLKEDLMEATSRTIEAEVGVARLKESLTESLAERRELEDKVERLTEELEDRN